MDQLVDILELQREFQTMYSALKDLGETPKSLRISKSTQLDNGAVISSAFEVVLR